ncbi:uncharacterized protein LOC115374680 [Myripristis murdjan]|uniref:uncharacterized protein LOC115374680 n=1 Tax=Myripristis murdjan TaxID=586833 RepID=UPI0011764586|nr:uncharacterized protein LOC115374680 [Myripristis murdjan]
MDPRSPVKSRMVVVSGVPDVLPASRMIDKLTIHFQSSRSDGGDVEDVKYPTNLNGVAFVTFERAKDAERVVKKEQQVMRDKEFPEDYHLTVFPFTADVFFYVTNAKVDLSAFHYDQESLIQSLKSTHRWVRFQAVPQEKKATVEGPFTAIKALREDLISRANRYQNLAAGQTAAVKRKGTPNNLRAVSHHESLGSLRSSNAETNQEVVASNGRSKSPHSTGDATEDQRLLSNAKNQNSRIRQKLLGADSFCYTISKAEEELSTRGHVIASDVIGSVHSYTEYRAEQAEATTEEVLGKAEMNAGIRSFLSRPNQRTTEEISTEQTVLESISGKQTRLDSISATQTRGESILGSHHISADYRDGSDQSSTAVNASLKDMSASLETDSRHVEGLEDLDDECIWVDSNTFRYVERFDREFSRFLKEYNVSIQYDEGSELTRVSLTGPQTDEDGLPSDLPWASARLKRLFERWQTILRVHLIDIKAGERQRLLQICDDVNDMFKDVLYMEEDSYIKVVGPSTLSHLFCKWVKEDLLK